jgi:hypothetical protein
MTTKGAAYRKGMMAFPSVAFVSLAAALLLLLPGSAPAEEALNVPLEGFSALFNGKDFTGWQLSPLAHETWSIEDGILKSHGGFTDYSATLVTEKKYRDFVLLADYREPSMSVSGIWFRGWPAGLPTNDTEVARKASNKS